MATECSPWDKRTPASHLSRSLFLGQEPHSGERHLLWGNCSFSTTASQGCQASGTDAEGGCSAGASWEMRVPQDRPPLQRPSPPSQEIQSALFPTPTEIMPHLPLPLPPPRAGQQSLQPGPWPWPPPWSPCFCPHPTMLQIIGQSVTSHCSNPAMFPFYSQ